MTPDLPPWLPLAYLLPAFIVRWAVAAIEGAWEMWDDEDEEAAS